MTMTELGKILLVDDNPFDAQLTMHYLSKSGLKNNVIWVSSTDWALNYLNENSDVVLALIDIKMPNNGVSLSDLIRGDRHLFRIPIIFLTGDVGESREMYKLGAIACLEKPLNMGAFFKVLVEYRFSWNIAHEDES